MLKPEALIPDYFIISYDDVRYINGEVFAGRYQDIFRKVDGKWTVEYKRNDETYYVENNPSKGTAQRAYSYWKVKPTGSNRKNLNLYVPYV